MQIIDNIHRVLKEDLEETIIESEITKVRYMELKKMELTSASGSELNLEALYQIMPSAFTEVRDDKTGEIAHKINFNTLRELLGDNAYEGADEEYGFKWVGKNAARREAARPINKTP